MNALSSSEGLLGSGRVRSTWMWSSTSWCAAATAQTGGRFDAAMARSNAAPAVAAKPRAAVERMSCENMDYVHGNECLEAHVYLYMDGTRSITFAEEP